MTTLTKTRTYTLHAVTNSGNRKVKGMAVFNRPQETCPGWCPLLGSGCYAEYGPAGQSPFKQTNDFMRDWTVPELVAHLKSRPSWPFLRDRVAGDVLKLDSQEVDIDYLQMVIDVSRQVEMTPFGYTHAWKMVAEVIELLDDGGYTMNASCDTTRDVEHAVDLGLPVTIVSDTLVDGDMVAGLRVVTCPFETRGVQCKDCRLCIRPGARRKYIVRFHPHGTGIAKARAALALLQRQVST